MTSIPRLVDLVPTRFPNSIYLPHGADDPRPVPAPASVLMEADLVRQLRYVLLTSCSEAIDLSMGFDFALT